MARKPPPPAAGPNALPFERPIEDVRGRLRELEELAEKTNYDLSEELEFYRQRLDRLTREIYAGLTPWNRVQVARHPGRPLTTHYVEALFTDWMELHGDGCYGDDPAMMTGLGRLDGRAVMVVGHRKGRDVKDRVACNFGSAHPEGYRKALRKMRLAEHLGLPVVSFVNTPGAYPGVGAEERGQARAIAENIYAMCGLRVPVVVMVIGEGGSGGALGIAVGDRVGMQENAWYSVISPEGCASILWRSAEGKEAAAEALKLTAPDLARLGIVDRVVPEPVGGAHADPDEAIRLVGHQLTAWLDELAGVPVDRLLAERHRRYRHVAQVEADLHRHAAEPGNGAGNGAGGGDEAGERNPNDAPDPARRSPVGGRPSGTAAPSEGGGGA